MSQDPSSSSSNDPRNPYGYDAQASEPAGGGSRAVPSDDQHGSGAGQPSASAGGDPYGHQPPPFGQQPPFDQQHSSGHQHPSGQQQPPFGQQEHGQQWSQQGGPHPHGPGAAGGTWRPQDSADWSNTPPAGISGVSTAPLSGQPMKDSEIKLWAILAQLSVILGLMLSAGSLSWVGPLVIYLIFKDRNRFVRFNAAESLNAAITVVIIDILLGILCTVFTVVTFGFGAFSFGVLIVPGLLHAIFAIVGAVKANDRTWWNYPINIRLIS